MQVSWEITFQTEEMARAKPCSEREPGVLEQQQGVAQGTGWWKAPGMRVGQDPKGQGEDGSAEQIPD